MNDKKKDSLLLRIICGIIHIIAYFMELHVLINNQLQTCTLIFILPFTYEIKNQQNEKRTEIIK